jgi:hypothetical protein
MVIAMTIFAVMSGAILSLYLQSTALSAKLKATRYLAETAREITTRIADDVRDRGISSSVVTRALSYPLWNNQDYSGTGSEMLIVWEGLEKKIYIYGRRTSSSFEYCSWDPLIHCGLYVGPALQISGNEVSFNPNNLTNLVDSFVPDEEKKRVSLRHLRFYISGDGTTTEHKVTLVFTLVLMPRIWVPQFSVEESTLHIETTLGARPYKKY